MPRAYITAITRTAGCCAVLWPCLAASCHDSTVFVGKLPHERPADAGHTQAGQSASAADGVRDAASPTGAGARAPLEDAASARDRAAPSLRADLTRYSVSIESGAYDAFCARTGSALTSVRADGSSADCEARVERRVFARGLCACEELRADADSFLIDSFDSNQTAYAAGQTGGDIGVSSAQFQLAKTTEVLGSVWLAGEGSWTVAAQSLLVTGDLKTNATLVASGDKQRIARDLWAASDVVAKQGSLRVDRDAYQAPGHDGLDTVSVAGQTGSASEFRVPVPCECDANAPIDVAALVAQARDRNDNAAASFDTAILNVAMYASDFQPLPCGRLFAPTLTLNGPSTYGLLIGGRSAVFVDGDLKVAATSTLFLAPTSRAGQLDLFIAGDVIVEGSSSLVLGNQAQPAATRVYVNGQIRAQGNIGLAAQLYAPHATFTSGPTDPDADQYGSIFARAIQLSGRRFHYDRAIQHAGARCTAPAPQSCAGCNECPDELACTQGKCRACSADADCCDPAVCAAGKCQTLVTSWP